MSEKLAQKTVLLVEEPCLASAMQSHLAYAFPQLRIEVARSLGELEDVLADDEVVESMGEGTVLAFVDGAMGAMLQTDGERYYLAGRKGAQAAEHIRNRFAQVAPQAQLHLVETHVMETAVPEWAERSLNIFTQKGEALGEIVVGMLGLSTLTSEA